MAEIKYNEEIMHWRATMDESLCKENSWLALAGLIWLEQGATPFGASENHAIVLRDPGIASVAGEFVRVDEEVT